MDPALPVAPASPPPDASMVQATAGSPSERLWVAFAFEAVQPDQPMPNAVILCQEIPEGWELSQADPPADQWDAATRVAKWLLMGDQVRATTVRCEIAASAPVRDPGWDTTRAWFVYRLPDGSFVEAPPTRHLMEAEP